MIGLVVAEVPALPLHTAGKYVAGAYIVLFALVLVYLAIMAIRLSRIESDLTELLELAEQQGQGPPPPAAGTTEREATLAYPVEGHK